MIEIAFSIGIPSFLIIIAMVVGSSLERKHFASIKEREAKYGSIPLLTGKQYPEDKPIHYASMQSGSVVVSIDHFKRFLAGLRRLFGGELHSYASLLDRARREAVLRLIEQCPDADLIVNLRIETSSISKGAENSIGSTEVFAYGTAIKFAQPAPQ